MSKAESIYRSKNAFLLTIELPGVKKEDIELNVQANRLHIRAERKRPEGKALHVESDRQIYRSDYPLGNGIDLENIEANLEKGVLYIRLKKNEGSYSIPVKAA